MDNGATQLASVSPAIIHSVLFDITFNPGPSQLSKQTKEDIRDAIQAHIPEISHRSDQFTAMSADVVSGLRRYFSVPDEYAILYTSSATDAMQITTSSLVEHKSFHFVSGAFSQLFATVSAACGKEVMSDVVEWGENNRFADIAMPNGTELITMTYNETSTGAMCADDDVSDVRNANPDTLLAVDITSIAGVKRLSISDADVWLFSVQKCFGLPAGLGILFVSPRALQRAADLLASRRVAPGFHHYTSMWEKMKTTSQTLATPNVLAIHLLGCQLARWNGDGGMAKRESDAQDKIRLLDASIDASGMLEHFVKNTENRSLSVRCIAADPQHIAMLKKTMKAHAMLLGGGYGKLRESTFRIANFPAINAEDMHELIERIRHVETD